MANAKKCDVCGKFYNPYNHYTDNKKYPNKVHLVREATFNNERWVTKSYDCCPDCMYQIGALIYDLQNPGKDETEFMKQKFNLPLEEVKDGN